MADANKKKDVPRELGTSKVEIRNDLSLNFGSAVAVVSGTVGTAAALEPAVPAVAVPAEEQLAAAPAAVETY